MKTDDELIAVADHIYWLMEHGKTGQVVSRLRQLEVGHPSTKFKPGDRVRKIKGSRWQGLVVGTYSTALTPEGYCVESETETGSVQIYPADALELVP